MVDRYLRPLKARVYAPLLGPLAGVPADAITAVGMAFGLTAAAAAALGRFEWALLAWWANRLLDGLDGELARATAGRATATAGRATATTGRTTTTRTAAAATPARGPYLDLMADLLVYAAVPLGLAAGAAGSLTGTPLADPTWVWGAAAFALAAFYLNLGSWALLGPALSAVEARGGDAAAGAATPTDPSAPGLRMPAGLMEGAETVVAFSVALWWPGWAVATLATIGALTLAGAVQRTLWGLRRLGRAAP